MNARRKWREFNKWWEVKREQYNNSMPSYAGGLAQSIDDKLKELQKGDKNER